jgi:hypothetical protein
MMTRAELHRLIDRLPEEDLSRAGSAVGELVRQSAEVGVLAHRELDDRDAEPEPDHGADGRLHHGLDEPEPWSRDDVEALARGQGWPRVELPSGGYFAGETAWIESIIRADAGELVRLRRALDPDLDDEAAAS